MPTKILMPTLSPTMTEGALIEWVKKDGEYVNSGDIIAEVESDKASQDIESLDSGILKIIVPAGTREVKVHSVIAFLTQENETEEDLQLALAAMNNDNQHINASGTNNSNNNDVEGIQTAQTPCNSDSLAQAANSATSINQSRSRIFASPLAKKIAQQNNIDLTYIQGSGPSGRIIKTDVLAAINNDVTTSYQEKHNSQEIQQSNEFQESILLPHSSMQQVIARRLLVAKTEIPHFYLTTQCNVDKLLLIRQEINSSYNDTDIKISINDLLIKIAACVLLQTPYINASWELEGIRRYNYVDVSIAVAVPNGLITPIIKNADKKSLVTISNEVKSLVSRAQKNELRADEFQGGGFTISNLGMYGVLQFNAIINPPQSCIMSVGAVNKSPVVINDQITIAHILNVSLSCDHRVINGALGAEFLQLFKSLVENPIKIFL